MNSKYIKTKKNNKLESKFFEPFRVLHAVEKQAYKLELPIKWKIDNVFHMSLLKQNTTKKEQVDNKALPKPEKKFKIGDDKEYKVETIINSTVYSQQANSN